MSVVIALVALYQRQELWKIERGTGPFWNLWGASIFFFGFLFALMSFSTAESPSKQALTIILFFSDTIAFLTNILIASRLTLVYTSWNGTPVDVARYLEWIGTCPVRVAVIGEITKQESRVFRILPLDYMMLISGFFASTTTTNWRWVYLAFSVSVFSLVVKIFYDVFETSIQGKSKCKFNKSSLRQGRFISIFAYSLFPISWLLVQFQVVDFGTGELLFGIADILVKFVLGFSFINATIDQEDNDSQEGLDKTNKSE